MNPVSHFDKKEAVLIIVDVQDVLMRQIDPVIGKKLSEIFRPFSVSQRK